MYKTILGLLIWACPTLAQGKGQRDLLEIFEVDAGAFAIDFEVGGQVSGKLTTEGLKQLEYAESALRAERYKESILIVEAWACTRGAEGADYQSTLERAGLVRGYLLEHEVVSAGQLFLLVHGKGSSPTGGQADDQHDRHGEVLIRSWGEEQMADLAGELIPPPPDAEVSFRYRSRGTSEFRPMHPGAALLSGDEFQIEIKATQPTYAYVFHRGSGGFWECLHPRLPARGGMDPTALEAEKRIILPKPGKGYVLDNTPGSEETFVYLGEKPNPRLERWMVEGVPWQVTPAHSAPRDLEQTVRVGSSAEQMSWYRRFPFDHRPKPE